MPNLVQILWVVFDIKHADEKIFALRNFQLNLYSLRRFDSVSFPEIHFEGALSVRRGEKMYSIIDCANQETLHQCTNNSEIFVFLDTPEEKSDELEKHLNILKRTICQIITFNFVAVSI
jgi:hypothetical protein